MQDITRTVIFYFYFCKIGMPLRFFRIRDADAGYGKWHAMRHVPYDIRIRKV